jgi:hypothetical protein
MLDKNPTFQRDLDNLVSFAANLESARDGDFHHYLLAHFVRSFSDRVAQIARGNNGRA